MLTSVRMQKREKANTSLLKQMKAMVHFLQYHPTIAIVTNIEPDHLENYDGDFNKLKAAYVQFLNQVRAGGKAIVCARDDTNMCTRS